MTNSIVKFEEKEIELVTIDGVPMMTLRQIGVALNFARPIDANKVYNAHADEFTPDMTRLIQRGRTRVRVFNREGAWLIGMFARTPKAAAFRKWVITALAEHVDGMPAAGDRPALQALDDLTTEKIAKEVADLQLAVCAVIKAKWFSELTEELTQAKKKIKEQEDTLKKISSFLPIK